MGGWLEKKIIESDGIGEGEGGRMVGGEDNRERWNRRRRGWEDGWRGSIK